METLIECLQKRIDAERQASCLARAQRNQQSKIDALQNNYSLKHCA